MNADGRDDVPFPPGVAGAVGEVHLVVAFTCSQQTQVLTTERRENVRQRHNCVPQQQKNSTAVRLWFV